MNPTGDPPVFEDLDAEPAPANPFWTYEDLALFIAMVLPSILIAVLLIAGGGVIAPAFFKRSIVQNLGGQLLTYVLLFGGLRQLLSTRYGRPLFGSLAWSFSITHALGALSFGPVLAISIGYLGSLLKAPILKNPFENMMQSSAEVAAVGFFAVVIGPLAEELAFRGFLLPLLARTIGASAGVLMTALAFALLHGPQYSWSWQHVVLVGSAGAVFGVVRLATGSTGTAFLMHATYNLTFFALALLQRSSFPEPV